MSDDTPARTRLLHRIGKKFAVVTEDVRVGPIPLRFTRVADPNRVLDEMADAEALKEKLGVQRRPGDEVHLPYWAELWDSAYGVATWMVNRWTRDTNKPGHSAPALPEAPPRIASDVSRAMANMNVLDLGCGMGLTGTVAAAMGARVTFADLSADALLFARLNALPFADQVRTRQLNWRTARLEERFDLIIGADILYERGQWMYVEPFWRGHLKPDGTVLLGEPGRATGDYFIDWIASWPWTMERAAQSVPTRDKPIRLFLLTEK
ncbi:MAG TPA: class I SAM-dependent methyltransferase [Tepidisphaeraceae bacterium]|nr:class I SAM-dependent methyltransferase [Tepidisphaeraceae bacterium]